MRWFELCDNPAAATRYYHSVPALDRFELVEAQLMHHSPSLSLSGTIPVPPDNLPIPAGASCDGANLTLAFWNLSELLIEGAPRNSIGSLTIAASSGNRVGFDFRSENFVCRGVGASVMIEALSPVSIPDPVRAARLFSYHNVWNSCLILARSKGFSLRLAGRPDQNGSSSQCRWIATKDDRTELIADTPIELAGLIALFEHHKPERDSPYWWRIGGADLVTELHENWRAQYFGPKRDDGPQTKS